MEQEEFKARFGYEPKLDDLQRATCAQAGERGHWFCGVCDRHQRPRADCGCFFHKTASRAATAAYQAVLQEDFGQLLRKE